MATVFRGEHTVLRRPVAIKVLHSMSAYTPQLLQRFRCEVRAVAKLEHPNIVTALDVGDISTSDGHTMHYFVMEYVPGQDLERLVKTHGPLTAVKACDVILQITGALAEADKHCLVHRDIKPSNIQVTPAGQAKLLDFGLVRCLRQELTSPGVALGSLAFMAPEQRRDASARRHSRGHLRPGRHPVLEPDRPTAVRQAGRRADRRALEPVSFTA